MDISGILVTVKPDYFLQSITELKKIPGTDIHQTEEKTGRIIITLESASKDKILHELVEIENIPNVIKVDLVYHYTGEENNL